MDYEESSQLKQRGAPGEKQDSQQFQGPPSPVASSLQDSEPDFVLSVLFKVDPKTLQATPEAETDLARLVKTLDLNKFHVTLRPHSLENHLLVFIKLKIDEFEKVAARSAKIDSIYGVLAPTKITRAERLRIVYTHLIGPKNDGGCAITVGTDSWKFVEKCMPVSSLKALHEEFSVFKKNSSKFLDETTETRQTTFLLTNLGSKYAFYLQFVSTYTKWLFGLALVGGLSNFVYGRYSKLFGIVNILTGVAFYLHWYAKEKQLALKWNQANVCKVESFRPTNKVPGYTVLFRKFMFTPFAIGAGATLIFYQLLCFVIEIFLTELYQGPLKQYLSLVPTILICSIVPITTAVYNVIVSQYLNFEGNASTTSNSRSYLIKMFVFNFLSSYMALIISSFIYLPLGFKINEVLPHINTLAEELPNYKAYLPKIPVLNSAYEVNKLRLNTQYQYFILTNQIVGLLLEFILPVVLQKVLGHPKVAKLIGSPKKADIHLNDTEEETAFLQEIRSKLELPEYNVDDDYRQVVIQFGFLMLFGPVSSLGPAISLIIELIQYKADYFKILKLVKPPVPERSEDTYPWTLFIKVLLLIGAVTSSAISLMYNGGDIVSSSSRSAVKYNWYVIAPCVLLSYVGTHSLISVGEMIVNEFYSNATEDTVKREQEVNKLLEEEEPVANEGSLNDVDSLIKYAALLPRQQAVFSELNASQDEKKQN